ncbi:SDR family NAD(P)-dependent oxidoreductase [Hydrocarboniphaga sp.]|uniref:SDR family NAD(P)-dependent oxidoreductase n=1 Tax=Hydrocarboniphaga sp. TaxID=2033016 RepID=UPI003D10E3AB
MSDKSIIVRSYSDSSVVIAGGTSGVGLATALQLVDAGVRRIALLGRNAERGDVARRVVLARAPEANVVFVAADASKIDQAARAVDEAKSKLGSIDVLINSTIGLYTPEPLQKIALEDIEPILLATMLAPMLMSRLVLEPMRERGGGVILNMASDAAKVPTPGETILGAGMAGIVVFSRTLAMEAKRHGIRVNAITPSLIEGTPTAARVQKEGFSAKLFERVAALADLGVCTPEDLASLLVFLSGPGASKLTGQTISVNGGISAA